MAGKWTTLSPLSFNSGTMLLLTDGTVMCEEVDVQGFGTRNWHKLTPDALGSYVNGTWSALSPLPDNPVIPAAVGGPTNAPLYFASALLRDGRVFMAGGEYNLHHANADILASQIYDPLTNSWSIIPPPPTWAKIGDAPSCVLPDGKVLLGFIDDTKTAIYDPVTNTWTAIAGKQNQSSEETWTLLPDASVLTANCFGHPKSEKFVLTAGAWVSAAQTPPGNDLVDDPTKEIGPAVLLPDARVFAIGATGKTAFYTMPAVPNQPGTWASGPAFPQINGKTLGATDGPASLLPNGRVLCIVGPVSSNCNNPPNNGYCPPSYFFEFDPAANTLTQLVDNPSNNPLPPATGNATYVGRMLLLPTGEVLFGNGSNSICLYEPGGAPDPSWKPEITTCPTSLQQGQTYTLQGRQLNGLSQAVSYGDDAQMATNYPLVRITDLSNNHVFYCRTANHSTMAVATGAAIHSTQFTVPGAVPAGTYNLSVVANGIPSDPITVRVGKAQEEEDSMSTSILNVWITKLGDPCKIANDHDVLPGYDWVVSIFHCDGEVLNWSEGRYRFHRDDPWIPIKKHVPPGGKLGWWYDSVPTRDGHVEIELPPGCYVVRASLHTWFEDGRLFGNWATERAIVQVCCGEHVCTTLYAPTAHACHILLFDIVYPLLLKRGLLDRKVEDAIKILGSALKLEGASHFEQGEARTLRGLREQMGPDAPKSE
ncbi:MAG TPA: kelch repeat-containing protein [Candidatus Angelobacter sp.]